MFNINQKHIFAESIKFLYCFFLKNEFNKAIEPMLIKIKRQIPKNCNIQKNSII